MKKRTLFSKRVKNLYGSPIRETLRVANHPGMISFAGGLPSADSFPVLSAKTIPSKYLQYGRTEGETELREKLASQLQSLGIDCGPEQILILSGSQQGIDLTAKLFIDPGSRVAIESPTYLAALQVFRFFGARFQILEDSESPWGSKRPVLAYLNPTFENPTGKCLSLPERRRIAKACDEQRVPLFEDDPYRDLVYDNCDRTPLCSLVKKAPWIYQGSFSKTFAPGLRIGYLAASKDIYPLLNRLKEGADLHTNRLSQWLVLNHLRDPQREERRSRLISAYRRKRDFFAQTLEKHFSGIASWSIPQGGLFFWLRLKKSLNTQTLFTRALQQKVAFMPGKPFFVQSPAPQNFMRLNFSHASPENVKKGLSRLAGLIRAL